MRRRLLLGGTAALFLPTATPSAAERRRISVLLAVGPSPEYTSSLGAFEQALARHGWRKDENLIIDVHWSAGNAQNQREAIAAVLAAAPDAVLVQSEAVTASLMRAGGRFPVVFVHVADPVGSGLVGGLARPEGRLTGLTNTTPTLAAKWLQLLRDAAPGTKRAAMLFNPETAALRGRHQTSTPPWAHLRRHRARASLRFRMRFSRATATGSLSRQRSCTSPPYTHIATMPRKAA
jgi:putative ABC transport system substrate-binding protein